MSDEVAYEVGDIVNGHVWTGDDWIKVIEPVTDGVEEYQAGSVVNEHAWTGSDWIPVRRRHGFSAKKSVRERFEEAKRIEEEKQLAKMENDPIFTQCGRCVAEGVVAGKRVKIYEKGYVQVGMFKLGQPERLVGINASDMSSQKTAIGRGIVGVATLGANIMLTPNKRGSLYLVIVTDRKTHTLTLSPPTNSDLKAMHKLEAAGKAVLAALAVQPPAAASSPTARPAATSDEAPLPVQLEQLAQLHSSGALTDEEFATAKQRLLGER